MSSVLITLADAVVAELNAAAPPAEPPEVPPDPPLSYALSMPFTAVRYYQPSFDLKEMKTLRVSVVPKGVEVAQEARGKGTFNYKVDIGVQKKLEAETLAEIDPLMQLVEEIAELFRGKRLSSFPAAIWVKTEHAPVFAPDHLQELRQFTSVMTLTFRVSR